jgi:hypothetical protein
MSGVSVVISMMYCLGDDLFDWNGTACVGDEFGKLTAQVTTLIRPDTGATQHLYTRKSGSVHRRQQQWPGVDRSHLAA